MGRDRNQHGQYSDGIPPETVLEVFEEREDVARPLTATDVCDALGIARRTAHNKLNRLVERGELETRKIGARGRVWWTPLPVDHQPVTGRSESGHEPVETPSTDTPDRSDTPAVASDESTSTARERDQEPAPDAEDPVAELDLPGSGANLQGRREAVREIYEYLKEHGSGQRSDFKEVVTAEATGYNSFNSFYTNCMGNGAVLAELPGVQSPGEGGHTYTYNPVDAGGIYDPTEEF